MSDLLTGYLWGGIAERGRRDRQRAARTAAGIVSDQPLLAEIERLRAALEAERAAAQANYRSAMSWLTYAAELEDELRAHGLMA